MKTLSTNFWIKRRILLTGHTGFKGAWMRLLLENMGADVSGVSLPPITNPNLYEVLTPLTNPTSIYCDIRNRKQLEEIVTTINPNIVIHMAAQPLVRDSYQKPVDTIETNVMGTVNLLEALRLTSNLEAILVITSDKVYANNNTNIAMNESNPLGGHDPYSASKAATEIVTSAYAQSFFNNHGISVCTARAGNVIGGGDWSKDRIIPDLWRAYSDNKTVELRYPEAVRPWQHVLDPLYGYLLYVEYIVTTKHKIPRTLNFGPPMEPTRTVLDIAKSFVNFLETPPLWKIEKSTEQLQESLFLSIDSSLAKHHIGWRSMLDVDRAILWTCEWYKAFRNGENMRHFSNKQIESYFTLVQKTN